MSVNSSFFPNISLLPPLLSSSNSSVYPLFKCADIAISTFIFIAFDIAHILLLLPLSILILIVGLQRWRRQRSVSSAAMTSHSDLFTYHMVAIELICFLGYGFYCCGICMNLLTMKMVGYYISSITFPGQILFNCLTCIERYLAVVHPITYLGLRKAGGVRVRNISIGCAWLLCFGWLVLMGVYGPHIPNSIFVCIFAFFLFIVSFCSLSVLHTLIRPGPGEVGGNRERVDQSKQRAFHTISAIMGVLLLWFAALIVCNAVAASPSVSEEDGCIAVMTGLWFGLPSTLVLPLLFLHRAGKLLCC